LYAEGCATHNKVKDKPRKQLEDLAARVQLPPFNLHGAGQHLLHWLYGSLVLAPPLDVSYCLGPSLRPPAQADVSTFISEVIDLEPNVKEVKVGSAIKRQQKVETLASARARQVYPLALEIQALHDMTWDDALEVAEHAWDDGLDQVPIADDVFADDDGEDEVGAVVLIEGDGYDLVEQG
jgi:hypothetical protein